MRDIILTEPPIMKSGRLWGTIGFSAEHVCAIIVWRNHIGDDYSAPRVRLQSIGYIDRHSMRNRPTNSVVIVVSVQRLLNDIHITGLA